MRLVQAANPDVVLVDIPADNPARAIQAIELLHQELPQSAVFAIGSLNQPQMIVQVMRMGGREFIGRPTTSTDLLEAFVRLTTSQGWVRKEGSRRKISRSVKPSQPKMENRSEAARDEPRNKGVNNQTKQTWWERFVKHHIVDEYPYSDES